MVHSPIQRICIQGYGCIQDLDLKLSGLHALIGPNDSGKSTVLRALRTVAQLGSSVLDLSDSGFDSMLDSSPGPRVTAYFSDGNAYEIFVSARQLHENILSSSGPQKSARARDQQNQSSFNISDQAFTWLRENLTIPTMVRFDPDELRKPSELIQESRGIAFKNERGYGLPSVFDAIVNRDAEAFTKIQSDVRRLFPSIAKLGLVNVNSSTKSMAVTLVDGTRVEAARMSEGLLYFLAFTALKHVSDSRLFLIEEPENGLHPARIAEVMGVLKELSKESQIVIATHSPLVINELEGHQVSVLTRNESGTHSTLLSETPHFQERSKVYALGELWVSYANGSNESPLLNSEPLP
jgi:ABC-type branched-subunit amino acid transport system ATPase component